MTRNPEYVTAADLVAFAESQSRRAEELLPDLLRRLLDNTRGVGEVSVRNGGSIGMNGYDGHSVSIIGLSFVPAGRAVWELGTGSDPQGKAQDDYRNRTDNPLEIDPSTTTFVVVTMRKWDETKLQRWIKARNDEGIWRSVVAKDVDALHAWVESIPAVHVWLSEQMGRLPHDVQTVDFWWSRWSHATDPEIPQALILAGRQVQTDKLRDLLMSSPAIVGVFGPSRDEANAFIAASCSPVSAVENDKPWMDAIAPILFILTRQAWDGLVMQRSPMVLIPQFLLGEGVASAAVREGHYVIIPMSAIDNADRADIVLPKIARDQARDALVAGGWTFEQADLDAAHARRSLTSLRRGLSQSKKLQTPPWSERPACSSIAPLILAGSWQAVDSNALSAAADHVIIAEMAEVEYLKIEQDLFKWAETDDPPFLRSGEDWRLAGPIDAWTLLARSLTRANLDRWHCTFLQVLSELEPNFELPPSQRGFLYLGTRRRIWSGQLRLGLAQGAVLLGVAESKILSDGSTASDHAAKGIRELLFLANADRNGIFWMSLADVLPLLAEAAPEQFLDGVETGLSGPNPILRMMFMDSNQDQGFGVSSPHTNLLWALETLSWSPEYLLKSVQLLARLTALDPGGRLSNRPNASLFHILNPRNPGTAATQQQRHEVLTRLIANNPDIGYQVAISLLPRNFSISFPTYAPTFRDWKPDLQGITVAEYWQEIHELVDLILDTARDDQKRWLLLIPRLEDLRPSDELARCLTALDQLEITLLSPEFRLRAWNEITKICSRHRQFPNAKWAMGEESLKRFDASAARLEPTGAVERYARLFGWHPDLPGTDAENFVDYDAALAIARQNAGRAALDEGGFDAILKLAEASEVPGFVGSTLAELKIEDMTNRLLELLGGEGPCQQMAMGWAIKSSELNGTEWAESTYKLLVKAPALVRSSFLLVMSNRPRTWALVDVENAEVQADYWRRVGIGRVDGEHVEEFTNRLITQGRVWSAIDLISSRSHSGTEEPKPSAQLIIKVLNAVFAVQSLESPPPHSVEYGLGVLIDQLTLLGVEEETLFQFEWASFPILQHLREPEIIFARLAQDPILFVEVISLVYKGSTEEKRGGDEVARNKASMSWALLRKWRRLPGLNAEGILDSDGLKKWVAAARVALEKRDRVKVGDQCIGELLSGSPVGADGAWPHEAVRDIIEEACSEDIETGLRIGKLNSRGVTIRSPYDGGQQEAALAATYQGWANVVTTLSPRTARLLREMADGYRRDADREDLRAESLGDQ